MEIEYKNNETTKFKNIQKGEVFQYPNYNCETKIPMMKIEKICTEYGECNAIHLTNGALDLFEDNEEVILKNAKLVIDN